MALVILYEDNVSFPPERVVLVRPSTDDDVQCEVVLDNGSNSPNVVYVKSISWAQASEIVADALGGDVFSNEEYSEEIPASTDPGDPLPTDLR